MTMSSTICCRTTGEVTTKTTSRARGWRAADTSPLTTDATGRRRQWPALLTRPARLAPRGCARLSFPRTGKPRPVRPLHRVRRARDGHARGSSSASPCSACSGSPTTCSRPRPWRFDSAANGFTALTLILSLQASYAAPLILLAQNRQDDRDRVQIEQDRQRSERNLDDTEYLAREVVALRLAMKDMATKDFIRRTAGLLEELDERRAESKAQSRRPERRGPAGLAGLERVSRARPGHRSRDPQADHRTRHGQRHHRRRTPARATSTSS